MFCFWDSGGVTVEAVDMMGSASTDYVMLSHILQLKW